MISAILYTSNAGSTAQYAQLLAKETGLPVYALSGAERAVPDGADVIYLGWIMAGSVKGYARAAKRYRIRAVCGVGMGQTGTQTSSVREKTRVPDSIPLFTLQGNFEVEKLHGIYRWMMRLMVRTAGRDLAAKENRTPEEEDMLAMMLYGGGRVRSEHLRAVLDWYKTAAAGKGEPL